MSSEMNDDLIINELNGTNNNKSEYRTYKIRWFILAVISLVNISNSINWICYSPIANYAADFYDTSFSAINYMSMIFMFVAIPIGFISFLVIDLFGIRSSMIVCVIFNLLGSFIRVLSSVDNKNGSPLVKQSSKYLVLTIGQIVCAVGGPFISFVSTKFANAWFANDQRALANAISLMSQIFGVLLGSFISSILVNSDEKYRKQINLLNWTTFGISLLPFILMFFIKHSNPPTPPNYTASINKLESNDSNTTFREKFHSYIKQIGKLLKSLNFLILTLAFGFGMGLFNTISTLIEQILCTRGYTDTECGIITALMVVFGIIGAIVTGILLDKTKRLEEISKFCFCMCTIFSIIFSILQTYDNDNGVIKYTFFVVTCFIGFFGLPILPTCMELSVECVYPIPEATSGGILFTFGQIVGIIMIIVYPSISKPVPSTSYTYNYVQTCVSSLNSTDSSGDSSLSVLYFDYPLYGQSIIFFIITLTFVFFFKCDYLRLKLEKSQQQQQESLKS